MTYINIQEVLPLYSVFILILILSGGYIIQLIPCKLQKILDTNVFIKHLFAFLTLIFLVTIVDPNNTSKKLTTIIYTSFLLYIFFIVIIKTHYKFFISIIIVLGIKYLLLLYKNQIQDENKNNKESNITELNNKFENIVLIQDILFGLVILLLVIGFLVYYGEKKYEYKNKFNFITFLFGKPNCAHTPQKISIYESLKYVF
jgi:hypothetical protein